MKSWYLHSVVVPLAKRRRTWREEMRGRKWRGENRLSVRLRKIDTGRTKRDRQRERARDKEVRG